MIAYWPLASADRVSLGGRSLSLCDYALPTLFDIAASMAQRDRRCLAYWVCARGSAGFARHYRSPDQQEEADGDVTL
jgi:hypothetical protein